MATRTICDPGRLSVLMVVGEFPPVISGIGDYTGSLVRELANLGCHVTVLTTRLKGAKKVDVEYGVHIHRILRGWNLSEIKHILRAIDGMGPGTVVNIQYGGFSNHRRPMVNLLPFVIRIARPHCSVVVTLHEFRAQRLRWRLFVLPMLLASDGVICVDQPDREIVERWLVLGPRRTGCIPIAPSIFPVSNGNGNRKIWRESLGVKHDTPLVVFFGGVDRQKGFLDLLEAVEILQRRSIACRLLAIGPYEPWNVTNAVYERAVRQRLEAGQKQGWAIVVDKCDGETVSRYLHASDVAVFPYLRGARSNRSSLLAAIAHGLPVVTTRGVDTPEGFDREFGVALVPPNDARALAERLGNIIRSEPVRREMRTTALRVKESFSWQAIANSTAGFYRRLACDTRRPNRS